MPTIDTRKHEDCMQAKNNEKVVHIEKQPRKLCLQAETLIRARFKDYIYGFWRLGKKPRTEQVY